jgi:hypothetical protein
VERQDGVKEAVATATEDSQVVVALIAASLVCAVVNLKTVCAVANLTAVARAFECGASFLLPLGRLKVLVVWDCRQVARYWPPQPFLDLTGKLDHLGGDIVRVFQLGLCRRVHPHRKLYRHEPCALRLGKARFPKRLFVGRRVDVGVNGIDVQPKLGGAVVAILGRLVDARSVVSAFATPRTGRAREEKRQQPLPLTRPGA